MFGLFGEGLETAFFPCTLVLIYPSIALVLGSRRYSAVSMAGFISGLVASAWLRFSGQSDVWPSLLTGAVFLISAALVLRPPVRRRPIALGAAGLLAGGATGSLWRPCVGFEFGEVLTAMNTSGAAGLAQLLFYTVAVMAPIVAFTAVVNALPKDWVERVERPLVYVSTGLMVLLGIAVLAGFDERVINRLFELSSF